MIVDEKDMIKHKRSHYMDVAWITEKKIVMFLFKLLIPDHG